MPNNKTVPDNGKTALDGVKTVFLNDKTVSDGTKTFCESGNAATEREPDTSHISMLDAALSDAAAREGTSLSNDEIKKGDTLLETYTVEINAIESGGMGRVWRVHHNGWNVELAMKRPRPESFETEKQKESFIRECEAWIDLGLHPNVVSCYYVREIGGTPTIFSEWMDGGSLEDAISTGALYKGPEKEQQKRLLDVAIQFARGLRYAHEAGLIHQDVKPDNVLITKEGDAKVADFGLARARAMLTALEGRPTDIEGGADRFGTIMTPYGGCTIAYCSMEQMDKKPLTRRTDIYSWAVSVMEMYVGARPWAEDRYGSGVVAGLKCGYYFDRARVKMPESLRELLAWCMKAKPEDRPRDFGEIEAALLGIYNSETGVEYPRTAPKAAADTSDSLNNRALSMLDLGKPAEAERCWERALKAYSAHESSVYNYSLWLWRESRLDDYEAARRVQDLKTKDSRRLLLEMYRESGTPLDSRSKAIDSCLKSDSFHATDLSVSSVSLTPSGRLLAVGWDYRARLWDIETHECVLKVVDVEPRVGNACCCGGRLYVAKSGKENGIDVFDEQTFALVEHLDAQRSFISFGADESGCYIGHLDNVITFVGHNGETRDYARKTVKTGCILCANGLVISDRYRDIELWDPASGETRLTLSGHKSDVQCFALSDDGSLLISGAYDNEARVWRLSDGKCLLTLKGHTDSVINACFGRNGLAATTGLDHTVRIWSLATGRCLKTMRAAAYGAAFSPNGDRLFVALDNGWITTVRTPGFEYDAPWELSRVHSAAYVLSRECLFDSEYLSALRAFEGEDIASALEHNEKARSVPGYGRDGRCMELQRKLMKRCRRTGIRGAWLIDSMENVRPKYVHALCFDSKTDTLYIAGGGSGVVIWRDGRIDGRFESDTGNVASINLDPSGEYLAVGGTDGAIETYRLADMRRMAHVQLHSTPQCIRSHPGGKTIAVGAGSEGLFILSLPECRVIERPCVPIDVSSVDFFPDGECMLVMSHNGKGGLLKRKSRDYSFSPINEQENKYFGLTLSEGHASPDGRTVLVGRGTRELILVDAAESSIVKTLEGNDSLTYCSALSPDGAFAASGGLDEHVKLWDIKNERSVLTLNEHKERVVAATFSHDGYFLATGVEDATANVYCIDWELLFPGFTEWDERARPTLEAFLKLHASLSEYSFNALMTKLEDEGFGYIRPEGIRKKLEEMKRRKGSIFTRRK